MSVLLPGLLVAALAAALAVAVARVRRLDRAARAATARAEAVGTAARRAAEALHVAARAPRPSAGSGDALDARLDALGSFPDEPAEVRPDGRPDGRRRTRAPRTPSPRLR